MKVIGIGDLLIPAQYIKAGFAIFKDKNIDLSVVDWQLKNQEELQKINLQIEQQGSEAYIVPDKLIEQIKDADILITQFCPVNEKVIDACKNLKVIGVLRGGCENVNLAAATKRNILVYNTPGRNSSAVADFTVGMLIAECRNIARSHTNLKNGKWIRKYANKAYIPDLANKTAGIIGLGQIGKKVAKRLHSFDMNIIAYDPFAAGLPEYIKTDSLVNTVKNADFLLLHSRLTADTKHMINARLLNMMKPTAYIINTARSGLVDEEALYETLHNNRIAGAALDVFDKEPLPREYALATLPNVTITPHLAGSTTDAFLHSPYLLAKEILPFLSGDTSSEYIINK
ncbi:2-hydroxyacid dehydrogenase [Pectinatus cerevisiiphilus]|uniref:D-3-phosphoglycerate dehydrogenase n=1 Tax=Pectinatus cerevisiiphilus TaxID=86956 RepID=A0A4R3KBZ7_9FIRM|nr:2-hydroxyacid dehydrogenase [Pectinatus cerevisiiphilus]TCS80540.1 D-3-phosphoglycerate dehydrogenase [Pectinatus cerevisiiphilus]